MSALCGLVEPVFLLVYLLSAFILGEWIVGALALTAFVMYIGANVWMQYMYREHTTKDADYTVW